MVSKSVLVENFEYFRVVVVCSFFLFLFFLFFVICGGLFSLFLFWTLLDVGEESKKIQ